MNKRYGKPRMLLHVCCAPCSTYVTEKLSAEYDLTLYFYNPNIHPEQEYRLRLNEARRWAETAGYPFIEGAYEPGAWFERTKGLEREPEKGERCAICFDLRLDEAAAKAAELGFATYGTALTVSPHKEAAVINRIGSARGQERDLMFIEADWKKKDGFKISTRIAREMGFYRQNYCGCVYSKRGREMKPSGR